MKKWIIFGTIISTLVIVSITLYTISIAKEEDKENIDYEIFYGTWKNKLVKMKIYENGTCTQIVSKIAIQNTWNISNEKLLIKDHITSNVIEYDYAFSDNDRTLTLTTKEGSKKASIVFTKINKKVDENKVNTVYEKFYGFWMCYKQGSFSTIIFYENLTCMYKGEKYLWKIYNGILQIINDTTLDVYEYKYTFINEYETLALTLIDGSFEKDTIYLTQPIPI